MIALYAALAMVAQDVLSTLLTQAEARNMAATSGLLDMAAWLVALLTLNWSLNAIDGHNMAMKVLVVGAVSIANYVGSWAGVKIGKRWLKDRTVEARLSALEAHRCQSSPIPSSATSSDSAAS
ncbi:MAG TPA: hypothetical protein VFG00_12450 [Acidothermaceae bacterium]|nr:hypothetical protein [Acidothermaceae bacterium]